jgi:hypothetical protein
MGNRFYSHDVPRIADALATIAKKLAESPPDVPQPDDRRSSDDNLDERRRLCESIQTGMALLGPAGVEHDELARFLALYKERDGEA